MVVASLRPAVGGSPPSPRWGGLLPPPVPPTPRGGKRGWPRGGPRPAPGGPPGEGRVPPPAAVGILPRRGGGVPRRPAVGPRIRCGAVRFPSWETGPHRFTFFISSLMHI